MGGAPDDLIAALRADLGAREAELSAAQSRITDFEAQVAALIAQRDTALGEVTALEGEKTELLSQQEALNAALAQARDELDAGAEAARLAAARREALEALIADLRRPITTEMVLQEINRYADSEFRYADKSDEEAVSKMVREMGLTEEAKRRFIAERTT